MCFLFRFVKPCYHSSVSACSSWQSNLPACGNKMLNREVFLTSKHNYSIAEREGGAKCSHGDHCAPTIWRSTKVAFEKCWTAFDKWEK